MSTIRKIAAGIVAVPLFFFLVIGPVTSPSLFFSVYGFIAWLIWTIPLAYLFVWLVWGHGLHWYVKKLVSRGERKAETRPEFTPQ